MPSRRRYLLLQARKPGDPMAEHEVESFAEALEVPKDRIAVHDLLGGAPDGDALDAVDLLLVGGSGDFSVLDDEPFIRDFMDFLEREVVSRGFPTFASCFGFQALVQAGGGEVVRDPANAEVGTFKLHVTEAGERDPLLRDLAPEFYAQLGHKDRATRLPAGMVHLAGSERAPFQALRVEGKPIVATQFHPELTARGNLHRYEAYLSAYRGHAATDDADAVLRSIRETPEATALLRRFVELTFPEE